MSESEWVRGFSCMNLISYCLFLGYSSIHHPQLRMFDMFDAISFWNALLCVCVYVCMCVYLCV